MAGDLVDKLIGFTEADGTTWKIPAHEFAGALYLWAWGDITRSTLLSKLSVYGINETEDGTQLDWLQTVYSGLAGDAKLHFFMRVEKLCSLAEAGLLTKTEFINLITAS